MLTATKHTDKMNFNYLKVAVFVRAKNKIKNK